MKTQGHVFDSAQKSAQGHESRGVELSGRAKARLTVCLLATTSLLVRSAQLHRSHSAVHERRSAPRQLLLSHASKGARGSGLEWESSDLISGDLRERRGEHRYEARTRPAMGPAETIGVKPKKNARL